MSARPHSGVPSLPTFEAFRNEVWAVDRAQRQRLTFASEIGKRWRAMIDERVYTAAIKLGFTTAERRQRLADVLWAVDRRVAAPPAFDASAAMERQKQDPDGYASAHREVREIVSEVGVGDGEIVPNELRWALLRLFGLREPDAPEWLMPGVNVFDPWRGPRGKHARVEDVDRTSVLLDGEAERVPMGWFLMRYERVRPFATRDDLGHSLQPTGSYAEAEAYAEVVRKCEEEISRAVAGSPAVTGTGPSGNSVVLQAGDRAHIATGDLVVVRGNMAYGGWVPEPASTPVARRREIDRVLSEDARLHPAFATARRAGVLAAFEGGDDFESVSMTRTSLDGLHSYERMRGGMSRPSAEAARWVEQIGGGKWPRLYSVYERYRGTP